MVSTGNKSRPAQSGRKSKFITCPECGGRKIARIPRSGESVCANCGLVISERRIDTGPEWRAFTADERTARTRTGGPVKYTHHDKGLATTLGWRNTDSSGRKLSSRRRAEIARLRKWQLRSRVHSSVDRNLSQALSELERLSSQLELKRGVKELAAMLYRKAIVNRLIRSRSIDALVAAAVYAACRIRQIPRSLKEIADPSHIDWKKVGRHYRLLVRKLKIKMPIPDPSNYVPKLITELGLPGIMQEKVLEVLDRAKAHGGLIIGRDPRGLAAGAIYIASILTDNRVTQREIASAAGVTEVTVRNRYKDLVRKLELSLP